jgi:hypothetical protein
MAAKLVVVDSRPVRFFVLGIVMAAAQPMFGDDVDRTELAPHSECLTGTDLSRT